jgi:hypothetical protein
MIPIELDRIYNLKEQLTYAEEGEINILGFLMPIVVKMGDAEKLGKKNDSDMMQAILGLVSDPNFRTKGLQLVAAMCVEPKLTVDDLSTKPSGVILALQLECVKAYIKSFSQYLGKKKASPKMTSSP